MCSGLLKRSSTLLTSLLLSLALLASGSASAQIAANCPNYADTAGGAYCINGSDTLFDIITQSIKNKVAEDTACTASGTCSAPTILQSGSTTRSKLFYNGTGSGNAETSMRAGAPSGGGAPTNGGLGTQSIGGMSRNFRPAVVAQFPSWQPTVLNVIGLDAAVVIVRNRTGRFPNFSVPLDAVDNTKAKPNNTALSCAFGTPGGGGNCYDNLLAVILSGVNGSGSLAACADPKRVQAIADFSSANGLSTAITHLYRRDDNSGTTDTFKDKNLVGRFCNGAAVGVLGANKTAVNLNNQDLDPIRRPCDGPNANRIAVSCTDLTTGAACTTGANCTQGLITALSDNDPGITDITVSIATRVGLDATGSTVGYAGREGIRLSTVPTAGPFINTNPPSDALVRLDQYLLARRLFLQRGPGNPLDDAANAKNTATNKVNVPNSSGTCVQGTGLCFQKIENLNNGDNALICPADGVSTNKCAGGGQTQLAAEDALFNYMTDQSGNGSQSGAPGRCATDPVVRQFGFLSCLPETQCGLTPVGGSNLCSKTPYGNPASPPSACFPTAAFAATGNWTYEARNQTIQVTTTAASPATCCSDGVVANSPGLCSSNATNPGAACTTRTVSAACGPLASGQTGTVSCVPRGVCSNSGTTACTLAADCPAGTGVTCTVTATCPAANTGRPANVACNDNAQCASGVCSDIGNGLLVCS